MEKMSIFPIKIVLDAAVVWMGYVLFRGRGTPAEHPERVR
jgi:hypothetical protein